MATLVKDDRLAGTRLDDLLRRQRKVPTWACNYPELFDPLRLLARVLLVVGLINCALLPVFFLVDTLAGEGHTTWVLAAGLLLNFGAYALVAPRGRTNAFYLRAFRTDQRAHAFRRTLEAGLGSAFRLSGIRPPRRHMPDVVKGASGLLTLFRYAGSPYMELEAHSGWMGRLVASYTHARIAFIDLRDLTEHVEREIVLTFLCLGQSRTVFIVDQSKPIDVWAQLVADTVSLPPGARDVLQFINADDDLATVISEVRGVVARLPEGAAGSSEAGWAYVARNVPESDLLAERTRRPGRTVLMGIGVMGLVSGMLSAMDPSHTRTADVGISALLLVLLYVLYLYTRAIIGGARRAWQARSLNREFATSQFERMFEGAILLGLAMLFYVRAALSAVEIAPTLPPGSLPHQLGAPGDDFVNEFIHNGEGLSNRPGVEPDSAF
jgi:hypothetical protein